MNRRSFQQLRLWAYLLFLLGAVFYSWHGGHSAVAFVLVAIVTALPFFELCPKCGELSWREKGASILWLGSTCHNQNP